MRTRKEILQKIFVLFESNVTLFNSKLTEEHNDEMMKNNAKIEILNWVLFG